MPVISPNLRLSNVAELNISCCLAWFLSRWVRGKKCVWGNILGGSLYDGNSLQSCQDERMSRMRFNQKLNHVSGPERQGWRMRTRRRNTDGWAMRKIKSKKYIWNWCIDMWGNLRCLWLEIVWNPVLLNIQPQIIVSHKKTKQKWHTQLSCTTKHHITAKKATANNNKTPHGLCSSVSDVIKQLFDNFSVVNKKQDEPCMCVSACSCQALQHNSTSGKAGNRRIIYCSCFQYYSNEVAQIRLA